MGWSGGKQSGKIRIDICIYVYIHVYTWYIHLHFKMETEREGSKHTQVLTIYRTSWHDTVGIWKASLFFYSGPRGQLWTVRFVPAKFLCVIRSSPGSFCQRHSLLPCLTVSGQWTGDTTFSYLFHMCFGPSRREWSHLHRPTSVVCKVLDLYRFIRYLLNPCRDLSPWSPGKSPF